MPSLPEFDFAAFKQELFAEIKMLLMCNANSISNTMLRTNTVKDLLKCSNSKLETLRKTGKLPSFKVLGTVYYNKRDVENLFKQESNINHD